MSRSDSAAVDDNGRSFVGRGRELAELKAALADALAGRGRLCLIVGEAGIGKTRLATELDAHAQAAGARVRWARCWEGGGAPAFWPWTLLVRGVARGLDDAALAAALGGGAAQVAALAPELRERVRDLPPPPPAAALDSEHARFPLFDAVTGFLRRAAAALPLVLVLDDLHAADEASLLLLRFLARDLQDARILLVVTQRELLPHADPELARLLGSLTRAGVRLPLAGWDESETERFVVAACGTPPPPGFVSQLHQLTEGNPFFVDEIVRLLRAEGGGTLPVTPNVRLPSSIRATIQERLRPLNPALASTLAAAAVIGREFDLALLRAVAPSAAGDPLALLAEAESAGAVVRRPGSLPRYAFAHALIREALYEALPPGERLDWHQRIGTALEQLHAADLDPVLDQIAHHFAHAAAAGSAAQAVRYDVRVARRAATLLAYEDAAHHLERALQALPLAPAPPPMDALELRLELGEMQAAAWSLRAARATFRAAAADARRLTRRAELARAALGIAGLGFGLPRGTVDAEIVAGLEEALAGLEQHDPLWARCAVRLAVELHFSPDTTRCDALSRAAVAAARAVGDPATLAYVINARHFAAWSSAPVDERLALADEAVRLAEQIGDGELALQGRCWRLLDLTEIGDVHAFDRELDLFHRLSETRRLPKFLGFGAALRGMRALWAGRFEDALASVEAAQALGERVGDRAAFMSVGIQVFMARRAQGRLAELEPLVRIWAEQSPVPAARCLLAICLADLGHSAEARTVYEALAADDFVSLQRRNALHPLVPFLTELCVAFDDTRRAPILYRSLLPFAGRNMGLGPHAWFGPSAHALGMLAALLDNWSEAERLFELALVDATRAEGPAWLAAVQCDYAGVLLEHGRDRGGRAAALAHAAHGGAAALGMAPLAARAAALAERAGAVPPTRAAAAVAQVAAGSDSDAMASGRDAAGGRVLRFPLKSAPRAAARSGAAPAAQFHCEGEYWTIGIGPDVVRVRDTSGLRYLANLLRQPGQELPALTLVAVERGATDVAPAHALADAAQSGLGFEESAAAHALLDEQARAAYKRQLDDLREELDEARRFNDPERAAGLEREIEFLSRELARAVGLHGRSRPGSTRAERARLNVTRAIRSAIKRIGAANRDLGLYFETTIKTGAYCSYTPDPRLPVSWTF